jgi:hypothetical protein
MAHEIKESDWKLFRALHAVALERFCHSVIEEIQSATSNCAAGYHDCFLKVFALLQQRNKNLAYTFDDLRRSNAFILLANMKEQGLLNDDEFTQFSSEARDAVEGILRIRQG